MDGLLQPTNNLQDQRYNPQPAVKRPSGQNQTIGDPINSLANPQANDYQYGVMPSQATTQALSAVRKRNSTMEDPYKIEKPQGLVADSMPPPQETTITAANQDWAKGDLKIQDDGVFFTPNRRGQITSDQRNAFQDYELQPPGGQETVAGHMQGLLASESPYMSTARASAMETANQRGLLNSTMAATAGEKAAIESALPIAQQDAGFFQNRHLQAQQAKEQANLYGVQGDISSQLQAEQGVIQRLIQSEQGDIAARLQQEKGTLEERLQSMMADINSRLQSEKGAMDSKLQEERGVIEKLLQEEQARQQVELQREQGGIQRGLYEVQGDISKQLAEQGFEYEKVLKDIDTQWKQIDLDGRMKVEYDRMKEETKARFNETSSLISEDYLKQYLAVLADPAFSTPEDRQAAVDVLTRTTTERFNIAATIAGEELVWTLPGDEAEEPEDEAEEPEETARPKPPRDAFGPGGGP